MGKRGQPRKNRESEADSGRPFSTDGVRRITRSRTNRLSPRNTRYSTRCSNAAIAAAAPVMEDSRQVTHSQVLVAPSIPLAVSGRRWTAIRGVIQYSKNPDEMSLPTDEEFKRVTAWALQDLSSDDDSHDNTPNHDQDHHIHPSEEDVQEGSNVIESPPRSMDITQMAAMLNNEVAEPDEEVVDSLNRRRPSSATANDEYQVKEEFRPTLRAIFSTYGNIARESRLNKKICTFALELVCGVVMKLNQSSLQTVADSDIESMLEDISAAESLGLDVGWLEEWVEKVKEAWELFKHTASLVKEKTQNMEGMKKKEAVIVEIDQELEILDQNRRMLEQRRCSEKEELDELKAEGEKISEKEARTKSTVKPLLEGSLGAGLHLSL